AAFDRSAVATELDLELGQAFQRALRNGPRNRLAAAGRSRWPGLVEDRQGPARSEQQRTVQRLRGEGLGAAEAPPGEGALHDLEAVRDPFRGSQHRFRRV